MRVYLIICFLLLFAAPIRVSAQVSPTYTVFSGTLKGNSGSGVFPNNTIVFSATNKSNYLSPVLREKNKSARLYLTLDAGSDYVKNASAWAFTAKVVVDYQFQGGPVVQRTLTISHTDPEVVKIDDVMPVFNSASQGFTATVVSIDMEDGASAVLTGPGLLYDFLSTNIRLGMRLVREYEVDVRLLSNGLMAPPPMIQPVLITGRLVTFSWQPVGTEPYPEYEIQVLKLYNTDPSLDDQSQISAPLDWSRALKVETQSYLNTIKLTMAEGTGYYVWRVRGIGNYFPGGGANSENYGEWSYSANTATIALTKGTLQANHTLPYAFYLKDPDENINWIYHRVFTEGDRPDQPSPAGLRSSEGISYGDGLQRPRQEQAYSSSENRSMVSQTIHDYSGRPALTTVPTPVTGHLNGYIDRLVTTGSNTLYTAAQFDDDANIDDPLAVQDFNTAYSYYSDYPTIGTGIDNSHVPDAQGYPFRRTLYKTDGTNRVAEESGIGKRHAIGQQSLGKGRTVRTLYGTPSDEELISIFGDEAPLPESVIKTTTIDQNNVFSVTYTSKEGKVIATALASPSTDNLGPLDQTAPVRTVINAISQNMSTEGKIIASKRVSVPHDGTDVSLSYTVQNLPSAGAGCLSAACNYQMRFLMIDLSTNKTYVSDADLTTPAIDNFTTAGSFMAFPPDWGLVETGGTHTITPSGVDFNMIVLNSGEYVFTKELYSTNGANYAEGLVDEENDKIRPVLDAIAEKMKDVSNPLKRIQFKNWMNTLKTMVDQYNAGTGTVSSQSFIDHLCLKVSNTFTFPTRPYFDLEDLVPTPGNTGSSDMVISMQCCGQMKVELPDNSVCYACEGSPEAIYQTPVSITTMTLENQNVSDSSPSGILPYGLDDLEADPSWDGLPDDQKRSAVRLIVEHEFINPLKEKMAEEQISESDLWKMAPGFSFESLNFMISNMLISRYYTGSVILDGSTWYEAVKDPSGDFTLGAPVLAYSSTYPHNYECKKLWEAWIASVQMLGSFTQEPNDNNVINEYDDQNGNSSALSSILNADNWSQPLQSALALAELALKKTVNKHKNSRDGGVPADRLNALTSLVANFIDIAGYSFAAIIDGSDLPSYMASAADPVYPYDYFDFSHTAGLDGPPHIYASITTGMVSGVHTHTGVPLLFDENEALIESDCNGTMLPELYYSYTLKPEWMFKYYTYNVFENKGTSPGALSYIDDDDFLVPNQVLLDIARNYNEPFSYLPSAIINAASLHPDDLCSQTTKPTYTLGMSTATLSYVHQNWSSAERRAFYDDIKGAARCFTTKGISTTDNYYSPPAALPTCPTKAELVTEAVAILNTHITACLKMGPRLKEALISELESSCYTIVACHSSPQNPAEITLREINIMVDAVIDQSYQLLMGIMNNFTFTPSNNIACTTAFSSDYSDNDCDLPACIQYDCPEVFLYEDNTLGLTNSRRMSIKYFADCDQKILDMLETGVFLPYVPPVSGCTKSKPWQSCAGQDNCDDYGEKTGCPPSDFQTYSKEYTVTATAN